MINPRQRFLELDQANNWKWPDVVDTARFQEAALCALAIVQLKRTNPPDLTTAAAWQWQMEGAKDFLAVLMALGKIEEPLKPTVHGRLNHQA